MAWQGDTLDAGPVRDRAPRLGEARRYPMELLLFQGALPTLGPTNCGPPTVPPALTSADLSTKFDVTAHVSGLTDGYSRLI